MGLGNSCSFLVCVVPTVPGRGSSSAEEYVPVVLSGPNASAYEPCGAGRRPGDHDWPGRYTASGEMARVMNAVSHACCRHRQRPSDEPSVCRVWEFQLDDTAPIMLR